VSYTHAAREHKSPDAHQVFVTRRQARAHLVASGDFNLHEAVDGLAGRSGNPLG
jgi:hypothetical protein